MTTSADTSIAPTVQWVDHVSQFAGIPAEFRRHGRYLYVMATGRDGLTADGHPVDGLQVVRTSPTSPTRLEVHGVVLEGIENNGSLGVRLVHDSGLAGPTRRLHAERLSS